MNTPKTDKFFDARPDSFKKLTLTECYDFARQLETQVNELREALEKFIKAGCGNSTSYDAQFDALNHARAILEKTK